jgi:hypothetical protein
MSGLRFAREIALAGMLLAAANLLAAPPKVDSVFPAGATRGKTTEITASGSFEHWPAKAWCDRPEVRVTAGEKKGTFQVEIDAAANVGVAWLRFFDEEGASVLRPFLISDVSEIVEAEPNNAPREMPLVQLPAVVNGRLAKSGDADGFRVRLKAGEKLTAAVQANSLLGSPVDALVQICELVDRPASAAREVEVEAFVLEQNHDEVGLDPLTSFRAERDGTYAVRVFGYAAQPDSTIGFVGSEACIYRLTLTTAAFDPSQNLPPRRPPHPVVAAAAGEKLSLPGTIRGSFAEPKTEHLFRFAARKGEKVSLQSFTRSLGLRTSLTLHLEDEQGKRLATARGNDPAKDTSLDFSPPADGNYLLHVRDEFGRGDERLRYELDVAAQPVDFAIAASADSFVASLAKPAEIPIVISRRSGFEEALEFAIEGLPAGVTLEPVKSEGKGESAKSVKLVLKAAAGASAASGPIKIVAKAASGTERRVPYFSSLPLDQQPHEVLWLTVRP